TRRRLHRRPHHRRPHHAPRGVLRLRRHGSPLLSGGLILPRPPPIHPRTKMARDTLIEDRSGGVHVIAFNRPEAKNAFNERMYNELTEALLEADAERTTRVVVLTGSGSAFSAGQDLSEMGPRQEGTPVGFERLLDALEAQRKPLIAAVNGAGVGLGFTMLLHTDLNLVSERARLSLPFLPLGVVPEAGSSFLLPQRIGYQRAAELVLTSRWVDADEAVRLGLALEKLPADELLPRAQSLAAAIAKQPPAAARDSRRLLRAAHAAEVGAARQREADAFRVRLASAESREALRTFAEKRPPNFDGLEAE